MHIELLMTGNEIMSGDTVDSNSSMIARGLVGQGFAVNRKVAVGDDYDQLVNQISSMSSAADAVIINGGLGPTIDDLTAQALAQVAGVDLVENPEAASHVRAWCKRRGFLANTVNMKQALLPRGVHILANTIGSAVGFALVVNDCLVMCTPGVPSELRIMLEGALLPELNRRFPDTNKPAVLRYSTFGLGESRAQQMVYETWPEWPREIDLGFRSGGPQLELKLTIEDSKLTELRDLWASKLTAQMGDFILGADDTTVAEAVTDLLRKSGSKLAIAESSTAGLLASMMASAKNSAAVFDAGIVCRSDASVQSLLQVSTGTLDLHGGASEVAALEMAEGILKLSPADYAVAVSAVDETDGSADAKPAGTVWLAWGRRGALRARSFYYPANHTLFQSVMSMLALDLIRRELLNIEGEPDYYQPQ